MFGLVIIRDMELGLRAYLSPKADVTSVSEINVCQPLLLGFCLSLRANSLAPATPPVPRGALAGTRTEVEIGDWLYG